MSPVHSAPRPPAPSRPVQHGAAGEVHPGVDQRPPGQDLARVAGPELHVVRPGHPLPVGLVHVDRDVAEGPAPLVHRPVEVRVREGDGRQPALGLDRRHQLRVQVAHAVPEHVAARPGHEQGPLPDRERRVRCPRRTAPAPPPRARPGARRPRARPGMSTAARTSRRTGAGRCRSGSGHGPRTGGTARRTSGRSGTPDPWPLRRLVEHCRSGCRPAGRRGCGRRQPIAWPDRGGSSAGQSSGLIIRQVVGSNPTRPTHLAGTIVIVRDLRPIASMVASMSSRLRCCP